MALVSRIAESNSCSETDPRSSSGDWSEPAAFFGRRDYGVRHHSSSAAATSVGCASPQAVTNALLISARASMIFPSRN